jgi:hypothetical protein
MKIEDAVNYDTQHTMRSCLYGPVLGRIQSCVMEMHPVDGVVEKAWMLLQRDVDEAMRFSFDIHMKIIRQVGNAADN